MASPRIELVRGVPEDVRAPRAFDLGPATGGEPRVVSVGRAATNDVVLGCESLPFLISRKHAVIKVYRGILNRGTDDPPTVSVEDLGSVNGTFRNGERLAPGHVKILASGDVVSFGEAEVGLPPNEGGGSVRNPFVFRYCDKPGPSPTKSTAVSSDAAVPRATSTTQRVKEEGKPSTSAPNNDTDQLVRKRLGSVLGHLDEHFECVICRDWIVHARTLSPCGHMACR